MKLLSVFLILPFCICSCSHLNYALVQAEYARIQNAEPAQITLKHMISHENFFVFGKTIDDSARYSDSYLAVAAYSDRFRKNERVDTMHFAGANTHYGLYLPEGSFTVLVFADINANRVFESNEVVGQQTIAVAETLIGEKVLGHVDIKLTEPKEISWVRSIIAPEIVVPQKSFFYPAGAIRTLDDPIFDNNIAKLGMYDPASFSEKIPTMFFALEEDLEYKIPVVFVHGIGGSARSFLPIIEQLDRDRYKPWFFYYPSGGSLKSLSELFYNIYLSGKVVTMGKMPMIIVAHSMGGLIVREALNRYGDREGENRVEFFVSIASPFGGHPAAASGEKYGLIVLPAWRDINPDSRFIGSLYRKPLPGTINHHLVYAYQNPDLLKLSENSDGVVPLSSQLHPVAQKQSVSQFGFNSSHTAILKDEELIAYLLEKMNGVPNFIPADHLEYYWQGGYDVELGKDYTPRFKFIVRNYGKYWMAVTKGDLEPFFKEQVEFVKVMNKELPPFHELVAEWLKFLKEYPDIGL